MANTYTLISGTDISSTTAGVTFSSIPQTYTDLVLRVTSRWSSSGTGGWHQLRFNGSTSGYYEIYGASSSTGVTYNGLGPYSSFGGSGWWGTSTDGLTAGVFGVHEVYIPNYTKNAATYQVFGVHGHKLSMDATANMNTVIMSGEWDNTSAITEIYLYGSSSFLAGSKVYLYGIKNS